MQKSSLYLKIKSLRNIIITEDYGYVTIGACDITVSNFGMILAYLSGENENTRFWCRRRSKAELLMAYYIMFIRDRHAHGDIMSICAAARDDLATIAFKGYLIISTHAFYATSLMLPQAMMNTLMRERSTHRVEWSVEYIPFTAVTFWHFLYLSEAAGDLILLRQECLD